MMRDYLHDLKGRIPAVIITLAVTAVWLIAPVGDFITRAVVAFLIVPYIQYAELA